MTTEGAQERVRTRQLARLGALFAGFAHEIRNPLSTISLNLQLVKEDFGDSEQQRDRRILRRITVVESEVKRLQSVLEEFLGYVRVPRLDRNPVQVDKLLEELVEFVEPEMQAKGVSLRLFAESRLGTITIDREKIWAVMVNLLRNAKDACSEGDQIMVSSRRVGGDAVLQVTDTGPGMEPEVQEQAFTPYFSTKKSGTGLGLPTARRLIELHDGRLELSSEPGRGTQFTITLPVSQAAEGEDKNGDPVPDEEGSR